MRSSPAPSTHSSRRFAAEDGVHAWRACGSRAAAWFSGRGKPVGRRSNCFLSTRGRVHGIRDDDGTYVRRRKPAGQAVNVPAVIQAEKKSVPIHLALPGARYSGVSRPCPSARPVCHSLSTTCNLQGDRVTHLSVYLIYLRVLVHACARALRVDLERVFTLITFSFVSIILSIEQQPQRPSIIQTKETNMYLPTEAPRVD